MSQIVGQGWSWETGGKHSTSEQRQPGPPDAACTAVSVKLFCMSCDAREALPSDAKRQTGAPSMRRSMANSRHNNETMPRSIISPFPAPKNHTNRRMKSKPYNHHAQMARLLSSLIKHLCLQLSMLPSIYLSSVHLVICSSVVSVSILLYKNLFLSLYLSICLSLFGFSSGCSICISQYLPMDLSINVSFHLFVHLPI